MKKTKKEIEITHRFWLVDYLDSHSVCDLWCLLCYKTEDDSNWFVSILIVIQDWADLTNRPRLAHTFTSKTNKDPIKPYTFAAELIHNDYKHAICHFITSFYELRK